jgi:outer membrane receptor protein involved in Fe transport
MNARSERNLLAALALVASIGFSAAVAQEAAAPGEKKEETVKLEKFEVTGSRILRADVEGPAPVQVINRETIEVTGASTVQDVLLKLPSNFAGVTENINNQGATGGSNRASLRGLGAETTLVLVNGRRIAPSAAAGASSFVNINSIPLAAVERIEVLPDGASSIYGSDAIAGVINVILRKDYQGTEATVRYGNTFKKDVGERRFNLVTGASSAKSNVVMILDYYSRNSQLRLEREFSSTADQSSRSADGIDFRSPTGNPGTVYLRPGSAYFTATNPLGLPANPSGIFGIPDGSTGIWTNAAAFASTLLRGVERTFDFAGPNQNVPEQIRVGFNTIGNYKLNDYISSYAEVSYNRTETRVFLAATPVSAFGAANVIPANNPYNPFGEAVNFRFRPLDVGPRTNDIQTDDYRILGGFKGEINDRWNYDASYMLTSSKIADLGTHYIVTSDVIAAASGTLARAPGRFLNVFGDKQGNDPALLRALDNTVTTNGELRQQTLAGQIGGDLFDIWAGPIGVSIGGEKRRERLTVVLDPLTQTGAFAGSGTRENTNGARIVTSAYAELSIPLVSKQQGFRWLQSAELQVAGRTEKYDTSGGAKVTANKPKVAIALKPTKELVVRFSYSEGFRAPSLFELFSGANGSFPSVNDPLRGNTAAQATVSGDLVNTLRYWVPSTPVAASVSTGITGIAADDNQQVQVAQRGNTNLQPEESRSKYAGIVYSPTWLKGFSMGAAWFKITHNNIIRLPSNTSILRDPTLQFLVRREPQTAADVAAGRPGRLAINAVAIFQQYVNLAVVEDEGFDFDVNYDWKTKSFGKFKTSLAGTYMLHFWDQTTVTGARNDNVGTGFSSQGTIPRVKANLQQSWSFKDWGATAFVNYSGRYQEFSDVTGDERTIEPYVTLDLQGTWSFKTPWLGGTSKIVAGCLNVTDVQPPFVGSGISGSGNTGFDAQVADPRGRFYYVEFKQSF